VAQATEKDYDAVMDVAVEAFKQWRMLRPRSAGSSSAISVRRSAEERPLGKLVSSKWGRSQEGWGEVQEMIDICDFSLGSRASSTGSRCTPSARGTDVEQWHPLGVVGVISAFNFPVAVWLGTPARRGVRRRRAVEAVVGDPLTAVAVQHICNDVMKSHKLKDLQPRHRPGFDHRRKAHQRQTDPSRLGDGFVRDGVRIGRVVARGSDGRSSSSAAITRSS